LEGLVHGYNQGSPAKASRFERIDAHTHVKGLGLDENLKAAKIKDGMIGQEKVTVQDVERVNNLFMDIGEAMEHLRKHEEKLMTH
jgi:DNA helicase TIP49 (TBP-interacting protein)